MKFKAIILDFDGVIVESVGIKDWAFETLFKDYPGHLDEIMRYHLSHNATIRFEKFRHITENILHKKYTEKIEKDLSERFSELVFKRIIECSYVSGAEDFLEYFYSRVPLYLVSVSPVEELENIIKERHLEKYFKKIYAIPSFKEKAIQDILTNENIFPEEALFIGDSFEDYDAAQKMKIFFIGRDSKKSFNGAQIPIYKNMFDIKRFLCRGFG